MTATAGVTDEGRRARGMHSSLNVRTMTARALQLDRVAVEVSAGLAADQVRAVLLKGAAIATWLYDEGACRSYGDADLLVAPSDFARAEQALAGLGFVLKLPGLSPAEETPHARLWVRGTDKVDLHRCIWGVGVDPPTAWTVLAAGTEVLRIGGGSVEVLGLAARCLHLTLHAAQHGGHEQKPLQDLLRAGERVHLDTWRHAAALARDLRAEAAMAAGMRLVPSTASLADTLGLPHGAPLWIKLRTRTESRDSFALARVLQVAGLKAKAARAGRYLFPSPNGLVARYPFAGRGPVALVLTYLWWPMSLARRVPRVVFDVRRVLRRDDDG